MFLRIQYISLLKSFAEISPCHLRLTFELLDAIIVNHSCVESEDIHDIERCERIVVC